MTDPGFFLGFVIGLTFGVGVALMSMARKYETELFWGRHQAYTRGKADGEVEEMNRLAPLIREK